MIPSILSAHLADFADEVRASTVRRFRQVLPSDWGWQPRPDLLSFGDVLKHLVDADRWLFDWLDGRASTSGVVIAPGDANTAQCDLLLNELVQTGAERSRRIRATTATDLVERLFDLGPRGVFTLLHLILRCNLDHEIHHRGGLQLAIRLRYG